MPRAHLNILLIIDHKRFVGIYRDDHLPYVRVDLALLVTKLEVSHKCLNRQLLQEHHVS